MKKQIFAVCDLEAEYARNFMDYLNQKKNIPFEIQAFTNVSSFVAYAKEIIGIFWYNISIEKKQR